MTRPVIRADKALVRHILLLGGLGRPTPYHSTTEDHGVAQRFAGTTGRIYTTSVARTAGTRVSHIPNIQLLGLLKGRGKGDAKWHSALEVMNARRYVELWSEHILSFTKLSEDDDLVAVLAALYE